MTLFSYTTEAWATLTKNPQDRRNAVQSLLKKLDGHLVDLYYSFGESDGVVIYEAPDDTVAAAFVLAAHAPGHLKATKTTRLFTVKEMMQALHVAGTLSYEGPSASA